MDDAVVDTNTLVSGAIGSPRAASARVIDAYYAGSFRLVFFPRRWTSFLPSIQAFCPNRLPIPYSPHLFPFDPHSSQFLPSSPAGRLGIELRTFGRPIN
jgi:hypothetical protein